MAFTCCGENKVCDWRSHTNVGNLCFLFILDGFSASCSVHVVAESETYLIQLIQRPLPNKQDWKHLASQCVKATSWLRPGKAAASLLPNELFWCHWLDSVSISPDGRSSCFLWSAVPDSPAPAGGPAGRTWHCEGNVFSDPLETMATVAGTCLLTVGLCAGQRTLHPAALAGGF